MLVLLAESCRMMVQPVVRSDHRGGAVMDDDLRDQGVARLIAPAGTGSTIAVTAVLESNSAPEATNVIPVEGVAVGRGSGNRSRGRGGGRGQCRRGNGRRRSDCRHPETIDAASVGSREHGETSILRQVVNRNRGYAALVERRPRGPPSALWKTPMSVPARMLLLHGLPPQLPLLSLASTSTLRTGTSGKPWASARWRRRRCFAIGLGPGLPEIDGLVDDGRPAYRR